MKAQLLKAALLSGITALCGASASFGAIVYTQTSGTGLTTNATIIPTALDDVTFAAGATTVPQTLSGLTFGIGVLPTAATTGVAIFNFYDTVNMASTGVVESSFLGGFSGTLTIAANTGTTTSARAFTFAGLNTLATPINFNDNSIGVVITLANAAGTAYSTILTPLFSVPGTPTVGSSVPGSYRDAANDDFQASDFSATAGNLYLSLTTVNAVPEPTTVGMIVMGAAGLVVFRRKRRAATV